MKLSTLEADFIGDLAQDSHGLWEVFEFVRLHHPALNEGEVYEYGCTLVRSWASRGWLTFRRGDGSVLLEPEALQVLFSRATAMVASDDAPWLTLSPRAFDAVPWLRL